MNERLTRYGPGILVALTAIAVYANALANGFAFDDVFIVQNNPRVHALHDLRSIWMKPYWPSFGVELGLWRPLTILAYAVQWAVAGDAPWFFHLVNILLHATASVLAFRLLFVLTRHTAAALFGGLLFAVHPVHTEVVANVVGQAELIAGVTTLAACLLHASRPEGSDVSWPRRVGLVILFLAGTFAKESAIVLPALLIAIDVAQQRVTLQRASLNRYLRSLAMPVFLLAAGAVYYFSLRVSVLGSIGGLDAAPSLPFLRSEHRVLIAFRAWLEYARLLVFPLDLSADYSPGVILPVEGWTPMVALGAVVFIGTAIIAAATPWFPRAGITAAWLLITALPTSNLLLPIGVVVAERLLYTPSLAASLAVAYLWQRIAQAEQPQRTRRLAYALAGLVLVLLAARTYVRNPDWKDNDAVFAAMIRDHPESYRSQRHNAYLAYQRGHTQLGDGYMRLAHRMWPQDPELLNEIGFLHLGRAQFDSAVAVLEQARAITDWVARTQVLLAEAYIGARRFDDAMHTAREAVAVGAALELVYPIYSQAFEGTGRLDRAVGAWRATIRTSPLGFWNYWSRLARTLALSGDRDAALAAADSARAAAPAADSAAQAITRDLRAEIAAGCYRTGQPRPDCRDEVGQWQLLAPIITNVKNAKKSQNAMPKASEVAEPDTGLAHPNIEIPTS